MTAKLISINDLPPAGKDFSVDDQEIWQNPLKEFKMDCKILSPLKLKVFVQPVDEGILVKGELRGEVATPCGRCAEDAKVSIDSTFSEYEEIPPENSKEEHEGYIVYDRHAPMLDLGRVAWEQFILAMPVHPLCKPDCQGLCPECGANLNETKCSCATDKGDPRLAALRNIKIER